MLVKGLPLAYNRDLQEDKERIFDSFDTVELCLELAAPLVAGAELNRDGDRRQLDRGHLDATTLMEYLIRRGMPQRTAHHLVGDLVRQRTETGLPLGRLAAGRFSGRRSRASTRPFMQCLGVDNAVAAFRSYGSTAPSRSPQAD